MLLTHCCGTFTTASVRLPGASISTDLDNRLLSPPYLSPTVSLEPKLFLLKICLELGWCLKIVNMPSQRQQPDGDTEKEASTLLGTWDDNMFEREEKNDDVYNSQSKNTSFRDRPPPAARCLVALVTTLILVIFALGSFVSLRSHLFKGPKDTSGLSECAVTPLHGPK